MSLLMLIAVKRYGKDLLAVLIAFPGRPPLFVASRTFMPLYEKRFVLVRRRVRAHPAFTLSPLIPYLASKSVRCKRGLQGSVSSC